MWPNIFEAYNVDESFHIWIMQVNNTSAKYFAFDLNNNVLENSSYVQ